MTAPATVTLRFATPSDAEALVAIYAPYILNTAITYEYKIPSTKEFARRIETYSAKYPYLVAEINGIPVGYAYACPLGSRPAFDWSVETAIYIREDCKGMGIGQLLYEKLEAILKIMGIRTMTAAVASVEHDDPYLTNASIAFHLRMGFTPVGTFRNAGCKFGRWLPPFVGGGVWLCGVRPVRGLRLLGRADPRVGLHPRLQGGGSPRYL